MNDHIPDEVAKCQGRFVEDPIWVVIYQQECLNCVRRMYVLQTRDKHISPWFGHGPCPDRLEMEK